ncbi:MAG: glycosyltransferase [Nonlabens sp.]
MNGTVTEKPLVSISCITFNHAQYIEKAINGFLMQKTDFAFEVLIHDDASTDGTEEIIREFEQKFPSIIKPLYEETNQWVKGRKGSVVFNFPRAQGKYMALCEGDDYWTDPFKLQKQVDFLERNPEFGLCFHKVSLIHPDGAITDDYKTKVPEHYQTHSDLAEKGNYIQTPSVMFRKEYLLSTEEANLSPLGDLFMYMIVTRNSKIGYIEDTMAVYRIGSGIWSVQNDYERNIKTALTFALLIKTRLFTREINDILNARILNIITRFIDQLKSTDLEKLSIVPKVTEQIFAKLLSEIELHKNRTNLPFKVQLKRYANSKLKSMGLK